jgi:hypothetical protein
MELSKNVVSECVDTIDKYKAIIIPEKSIGNSFWGKCKALERSFYYGVDWMEGARFFKKEIFKEFGGYDEKNIGTEDFDLPQKIKDRYSSKSIARVKSLIIHNEGNLSLLGSLKKKYYYGKQIKVYKTKNKIYFSKQASLVGRYLLFFSNPQRLLKNPLIGLGMLFMKACEFIAWTLGYILNS